MPRGRTGFEAFGADEKSLGLYPTSQDAVDAVLVSASRTKDTGEPRGAQSPLKSQEVSS
jgi:hypothetical protein